MSSLLRDFNYSILAFSLMGCTSAFAQNDTIISPKIMVITMFGEEAKPWLEGENYTIHLNLPGLSTEYPTIDCTETGLCHMTTAMGYSNAASSVTAMALSDKFDLKNTYFLIAGIAGIDPKQGTLGSATWAKYVIDGNLNHRIDLREAPKGWASEFFGLGASRPGEIPKWGSGTEVYELNSALTDYALTTTQNVELLDAAPAQTYRKHYAEKAATSKPTVLICDTLSSDTYWHGSILGETMEQWVSLLTDGKATYCTSQMEDNATLTALKRAADADRLDFNRIAVLRTASNFDRQGKKQSAAESLAADSGGLMLATANAYRVGKSFVQSIMDNWQSWEKAPPTSK